MNNFFYEDLPSFSNFDEVVEKDRYCPLPDDWIVGVSDVVNSTAAIAEGRYKVVNMAGASVISAVMNELGGQPFPFIFGGDGAGFAVPGTYGDRMERVLAACQVWSSEEISLSLRAAVVPVRDIRQSGNDDGLRLTVDCPAETIEALEKLLVAAETAGIAMYGLHRQESALMTCIVPSAVTRDHMHFVDGAAGGYAKAAEMLKAGRPKP